MFNPLTAERLPNGSRIERLYKAGDTIIVLADTEGYQRYVTWKLDRDGHAAWGHYFMDLEDAIQDFFERCRKSSPRETATL